MTLLNITIDYTLNYLFGRSNSSLGNLIWVIHCISKVLHSSAGANAVYDEFGLSKQDADDVFAMQLFDYWIAKHDINLANQMELKCFRSKVWEMVWVRESKQWDLGKAKFEFNLNSLHGHDVWYVASPFSWLPTEVKRQTTTFACKANDFGVDAHNFLCIRTKQLQRYCMEGLELIVYDRDIDMERPANARVTKFMRINGVDDGRELVSSRKLVFVEVKRLCDMYMRKQGIINLRIPHDKRHESERADGHTCAFAATEFPSIPIT